MTYIVRQISCVEELRTRLRRAYEIEEWNTCPDDAEAFLAQDAKGFFVGELDGKPISFIIAIKYSTLSFIGVYYVEPEFRGKSYGKQLWEQAWQHAADRTISLDGVETMVEKYANMGLQRTFDLSGYRFNSNSAVNVEIKTNITREINKEEIITYDEKLFGHNRSRLITNWLKQYPAIEARNDANNLIGFAILRNACEGYRLAVYANDQQTAIDLIATHCKTVPNSTIDIDIPHANTSAMELVEKFNMEWIDDLNRMVHRVQNSAQLSMKTENIYGITAWEIG